MKSSETAPSPDTAAPRIGSLFSGIGGFDLGLERAGGRVAWQCEIDKDARTVLAEHWPGVECYEDVKEIDAGAPRVDVLCGGFPCQDLSVAGNRRGLAGERSGLFFEFMRVAGALAPRWVLVENVPGLLSSDDGGDMGTVLGTLADLGYGYAWRVLDAQFFGVAQRRRRVFIVGCLGDAGSAANVLFEPESCEGHPAPCREAGTRVAAPTANGVGTCGADDNQGQAGHLIPIGFYPHSGLQTTFLDDQSPPLTVGSTLGIPSPPGVAFPILEVGARTGKSTDDERCGLGIGDGGDPMFTLQASKQHGVAFSENQRGEVRRLTPTECERLQGFPDDWTASLSDSARYRTLGNAVAVPVAEFIGHQLLRHLAKSEVKS